MILIIFHRDVGRVYRALTDAKTFAEFTGAGTADIVNEPGGAISLFGGYVIMHSFLL